MLEPRVGGLHYEDWGDGTGHLYAQVTEWDPPRGYVTRGPLMPGVILDSAYAVEPDGDESVLRVSKVAVGPMTEEEATGARTFGEPGPLRGGAPEGDRGLGQPKRPSSTPRVEDVRASA